MQPPPAVIVQKTLVEELLKEKESKGHWVKMKMKQFALLRGRKTCGSDVDSPKANDVWNKIKAEGKKHSTAKTVR